MRLACGVGACGGGGGRLGGSGGSGGKALSLVYPAAPLRPTPAAPLPPAPPGTSGERVLLEQPLSCGAPVDGHLQVRGKPRGSRGARLLIKPLHRFQNSSLCLLICPATWRAGEVKSGAPAAPGCQHRRSFGRCVGRWSTCPSSSPPPSRWRCQHYRRCCCCCSRRHHRHHIFGCFHEPVPHLSPLGDARQWLGSEAPDARGDPFRARRAPSSTVWGCRRRCRCSHRTQESAPPLPRFLTRRRLPRLGRVRSGSVVLALALSSLSAAAVVGLTTPVAPGPPPAAAARRSVCGSGEGAAPCARRPFFF